MYVEFHLTVILPQYSIKPNYNRETVLREISLFEAFAPEIFRIMRGVYFQNVFSFPFDSLAVYCRRTNGTRYLPSRVKGLSRSSVHGQSPCEVHAPGL